MAILVSPHWPALPALHDGAGLRDDPNGPLFRTIGRGTGKLAEFSADLTARKQRG